MILSELKTLLSRHPDADLRLVLPDGRPIPADFHVTEVGHSARNFMDCGGTVRFSESCVLQVWRTDEDRGHRLKAGRLAAILGQSAGVIPSDGLEVEIEYEDTVVSQYTMESSEVSAGVLGFTLGSRHTACLAREACGIGSECCGGADCS